MQEQPLYIEKHSSFGAVALVGVSIYAAYILVAFYYGTPELWGELWNDRITIATVLGLGALALIGMYVSSARNRVEFYRDRIESHTGKRKKVIALKEISRIWKGKYSFPNRGTGCFADDYPGARIVGAFQTEPNTASRRPAEIFVWNAYTSKLGFSSVKDTPLILELQNRNKVTILHVRDETRVIDLLKKHAAWITWSPVFNPRTRERPI